MNREGSQNNKASSNISSANNGGTGSMLQNSASMLAEQGQKASPVRKQIGKAEQDKSKEK